MVTIVHFATIVNPVKVFTLWTLWSLCRSWWSVRSLRSWWTLWSVVPTSRITLCGVQLFLLAIIVWGTLSIATLVNLVISERCRHCEHCEDRGAHSTDCVHGSHCGRLLVSRITLCGVLCFSVCNYSVICSAIFIFSFSLCWLVLNSLSSIRL